MTANQGHEIAMAVKVLCDVRLAALVLMVITVSLMSLDGSLLIVIGVSLAQSYLLLRHWDPIGARLMQGWWFPALESLVAMLLFVSFGSGGLGSAYLAASLALLACAGGWRALAISLGAFVPVVAMAFVGVLPAFGVASVRESLWLSSMVVLLVSCSFGGFYLRRMLFSRVDLIEQRRALELAEASNQERLRLARELHDGVSKSLHGCHMIATSLANGLVAECHPQAEKAQALRRALEVAGAESRDLLQELRESPAVDLLPYWQRVLAQWAQHNPSTELTSVVPPHPVVVSVRVRHEVLRILGELLENVRRHAHSATALVELTVAGGSTRLQVTDRGVGFDPQAGEVQNGSHFGLAGVRERAERLGGRLVVQSGSDGTAVTVEFPLIQGEE